MNLLLNIKNVLEMKQILKYLVYSPKMWLKTLKSKAHWILIICCGFLDTDKSRQSLALMNNIFKPRAGMTVIHGQESDNDDDFFERYQCEIYFLDVLFDVQTEFRCVANLDRHYCIKLVIIILYECLQLFKI